MLLVCYNNEKKIGVKPGDSRNETGQQPERNRATTVMKPSSLGKQLRSIFLVTTWSLRGHYKVTTFRFSFMNGSSFEPMLGSFWLRVPRGCVPDSVSLRFEFSFMNGSSFEPMLGSFWSHMLRGCVPDSVSLTFRI